jgi:hypothetical protein
VVGNERDRVLGGLRGSGRRHRERQSEEGGRPERKGWPKAATHPGGVDHLPGAPNLEGAALGIDRSDHSAPMPATRRGMDARRVLKYGSGPRGPLVRRQILGDARSFCVEIQIITKNPC